MYRAREENNSLRVSTISEGTSEGDEEESGLKEVRLDEEGAAAEDDENESGLKEVRLDEEGDAAEMGSQGDNSSDSGKYLASTHSEEEGPAPKMGEKDENHEEPAYEAPYDELLQAFNHLSKKDKKSLRTIHALKQRLDKANAEIARKNSQYKELARGHSILSTELDKYVECLERIEMDATLRLHLHRSKENTPTSVLFPLPRSSSPVLSGSPSKPDSPPWREGLASPDMSEEESISPKEWSPTFIHRGSDSRDRPSSPGPRGIRPPATSTAF